MIIVGQNKNTELLTFLSLAFVAPALAALISVYLPSKPVAFGTTQCVLNLGSVDGSSDGLCGHVWLACRRSNFIGDPPRRCCASRARGVCRGKSRRWRKQVAEIGLIASLVLIFVLFSPFDPAAPLGSRMIEYSAGSSHLLGWIVGALVFVALAVSLDRWEARHSGANAARWAAVGGALTASPLYDHPV